MSSQVVKQIDWEALLEGYGLETKMALETLLRDHDVPHDDPAAVVIASQFISQMETTQAFSTLSATLEEGRNNLSVEFKTLVEQLRGIVSFAQENLIETNEEGLKRRQEDLLQAVKQGVSKAIGNGQSKVYGRNTMHSISLIVSTGAISMTCLAIGTMATLHATRQVNKPLEEIPNAELWEKIAQRNQDILKACVEGAAELSNKCVIDIP